MENRANQLTELVMRHRDRLNMLESMNEYRRTVTRVSVDGPTEDEILEAFKNQKAIEYKNKKYERIYSIEYVIDSKSDAFWRVALKDGNSIIVVCPLDINIL